MQYRKLLGKGCDELDRNIMNTSPARAAFRQWALVVAFTALAMGGTMSPRIVDQPEFTIVGIKVRTNNAKETAGEGVIAKHWERFFKDGILDKIPHKTDANIYAVYTNYASDRNGDYDLVLGAKVKDASAVPAGMTAVTVSGGKYAVLSSAKGPVGKVVSELWQEIWRLEDQSQLGGTRAYQTDFEVYDERSRDPQNSQVDISIGLK
jgi:predicted transcriptional regulator YdeE